MDDGTIVNFYWIYRWVGTMFENSFAFRITNSANVVNNSIVLDDDVYKYEVYLLMYLFTLKPNR